MRTRFARRSAALMVLMQLLVPPAARSEDAPASAAQQAAVGQAPSESARRAALSPFRFILRHADSPAKPKPLAPGNSTKPAAARAQPAEPAATEAPAASVELSSAMPAAAPAQAEQLAKPEPIAKAAVEPKPLVPIKQDPPVLSARLEHDAPSGVVTIAFDVLPDGTTAEVKVVKSTNGRLRAPALAAVRGWRFQPIAETRSLEVDVVFSAE